MSEATTERSANCDGHASHHFERMTDCDWCGHPESEHNDNGFWEDDRHLRAHHSPEASDDRSR